MVEAPSRTLLGSSTADAFSKLAYMDAFAMRSRMLWGPENFIWHTWMLSLFDRDETRSGSSRIIYASILGQTFDSSFRFCRSRRISIKGSTIRTYRHDGCGSQWHIASTNGRAKELVQEGQLMRPRRGGGVLKC